MCCPDQRAARQREIELSLNTMQDIGGYGGAVSDKSLPSVGDLARAVFSAQVPQGVERGDIVRGLAACAGWIAY